MILFVEPVLRFFEDRQHVSEGRVVTRVSSSVFGFASTTSAANSASITGHPCGERVAALGIDCGQARIFLFGRLFFLSFFLVRFFSRLVFLLLLEGGEANKPAEKSWSTFPRLPWPLLSRLGAFSAGEIAVRFGLGQFFLFGLFFGSRFFSFGVSSAGRLAACRLLPSVR